MAEKVRRGATSSPAGAFRLRIQAGARCKTLDYPESETIYARGESIVETGGAVGGFMLGSFRGVNAREVDPTTIRVTFEDAFGASHETDKISDAKAVTTFLKTPDLGDNLKNCK